MKYVVTLLLTSTLLSTLCCLVVVGCFVVLFFLTCRRTAKTYKVGYLQTKSLFSRSHWKSWPTETRQDRMSSEQPYVCSKRVCPWTECQRMWHGIDTPSVLKHSLLEGGERLGKPTSLGKHRNVKIHKGPLWIGYENKPVSNCWGRGDSSMETVTCAGKPPGCIFCESSLFLGWWWSSMWVTHGPVCVHSSLFL